jgi:hypothetical protein
MVSKGLSMGLELTQTRVRAAEVGERELTMTSVV